LAAIAGLSQTLLPDDWREQAEAEFGRKDRDGDRKLSPDEMEGKLRDNLARWDTNRDGYIDFQEYLAFFRWRLEEKSAKDALKAGLISPQDFAERNWEAEFQRRDGNGDGLLSLDEMEGKLRDNLGRWDTNGDGLIDREEFRAFYFWKIQEQASKGGKGAPLIMEETVDLDRRATLLRAGKLPKGQFPAWFFELDRDQDGQVSLAEWRRGGKDVSEFALWDKNDDGLITPEEVLARLKAQPELAASLRVAADFRGNAKGWKGDKGKDKKDKKK